ncbi:HNH endonuclease signature motif containing protein [Oceaniglobus trochenteri]|uniref:HNH endonuclease signature motif containing protein n=1 Tax=Oceaniglobus trochenteri TaxID=2763260 RepID=UPI001CFFE2DE|nr:HNH endonuclease signature motif containing protein [Oceaniglobus trochenteri]
MADVRIRRNFTREEAGKLLSYNPDTGILRWRIETNAHGRKIHPGDIAGTDKDGYNQIKIFGRVYRAHHLAWLFMTGEWPAAGMDMDHINRDRGDNRWANLRMATRSQNNINGSPSKANKSGCKGVSMTKATGKWHARIEKDGKVHLLGNFTDLGDAIAARKAAELKMFADYSTHTKG